jgi:uncharacterized membrane protein
MFIALSSVINYYEWIQRLIEVIPAGIITTVVAGVATAAVITAVGRCYTACASAVVGATAVR